MKPIHEQYEEETGKRWFTNPVCHGEVAYASWEYQKWLEERASRMRQTLYSVPSEGRVVSVAAKYHRNKAKINQNALAGECFEDGAMWAIEEIKRRNGI